MRNQSLSDQMDAHNENRAMAKALKKEHEWCDARIEALREHSLRLRHALDAETSIKESLHQELAIMRAALMSIAANTCCDRCQEAALVARNALRKVPGDGARTND